MTPQSLYYAAKHLGSKVVCEPGSELSWIYCGTSEDLKKELLHAYILKHFGEAKVQFIPNRLDGRLVENTEIVPLVASNINNQDIEFLSEDFKRVMKFNKIGVFQYGKIIE